MRVQRGFNTAQQITSLFERVASSGYEDLTPEDRLAVLDLPDVDAVAFNISSITALSRSALIQRAAESPELLTETELDLGRNHPFRAESANECIWSAIADLRRARESHHGTSRNSQKATLRPCG